MRRRTTAAGIAAVAMLAFAGCSGGGSDAGGAAADESADESAAVEQEQPNGASEEGEGADGSGKSDGRNARLINQAVAAAADRDIIYTIDLSLAVDDVLEAAREATSLATSAGGFVANEATDGTDHSTITLKVPAQQHEDVVGRLTDLGKVTSRNRSADDVTQELVDTESRIASQRASIDRIRTLLGEATKIADVINIESELANREADLDALLQQQKELSSLASLATINISLHHPDDAPDDDPDRGFVAGLSNGWDAFIGAGGVALTVLGALIPFAVVGALVGVPGWYAWRHRRRPAPTPPAPEPERT